MWTLPQTLMRSAASDACPPYHPNPKPGGFAGRHGTPQSWLAVRYRPGQADPAPNPTPIPPRPEIVRPWAFWRIFPRRRPHYYP